MNISDFVNIYQHSPFMWINTCLSTVLAAMILKNLFVVFKPKIYSKSNFSFFLVCFFVLGTGAFGYVLAMNIAKSALGGLDPKLHVEALYVAKLEATYNLYFAGAIVILAAFLYFITKMLSSPKR